MHKIFHNEALIEHLLAIGNGELLCVLWMRNNNWKMRTIQTLADALIILQKLCDHGFIKSPYLGRWVWFDMMAACANLAFFAVLARRKNLMAIGYIVLLGTFLAEWGLDDSEQIAGANAVYWYRIWIAIFVTWLMVVMTYSGHVGSPDQRKTHGSHND